MTVINPNSVAGINSITVASGEALSVHKSDGTLIRTIAESTGISTFSSISVGSATTTNNADKSINVGLGASISSHANNTLSLGTGGDERARITSGGKVNIGGDFTQTTRQLAVISSAEQVASFEYNGTDTDGSEVRFYHNSSSPADGDTLAMLQFSGKNDADELIMYSNISAESSDVTNGTEDGNIIFSTRFNGSFAERLRITSAGNLGINSTSPDRRFTLYQDATTRMNLKSLANSTAGIEFGDPADHNIGFLVYDNTDDSMQFGVNAGERLRITGIGSVGVGINAPIAQFQVNSTKNAETGRDDARNYHLCLKNPADDTGEAIGLSFSITSNAEKVGAAILHERDGGGSEGSLQFYVSSDGNSVSEAMRINSNQNVQFTPEGSTSNPYLLIDSTGDNIRLSSQKSSGDGGLIISTQDSGSAAERVRITGVGSFGVGTGGINVESMIHIDRNVSTAYDATATDAQRGGTATLLITNANTTNNSFAQIAFRNDDTNQSVARIAAVKRSTNSSHLVFVTEHGGTPRESMRINSDGFIGVGGGTPASDPRGQFVINSEKDALTNANCNDPHHFHFVLKNDNDTNGEAIGMCFSASSTVDRVGAAIIHNREGPGSVGDMRFYTCATEGQTSERARISSGGSFTVGTTSDDGGGSSNTDDGCVLRKDGLIAARVSTSTNNVAFTAKTIDTGGCNGFRCMSAQTEVGGISFNSGGTSFNTSSDYRRKENIVDLTGAITRLKTLSPKRFNFKTEPSVTRDGFLAHEVTTVPEAVTGTKDAVATADDVATNKSANVGDPIYQQLDQAKLVPLLTAALQEAITKIETLETKVAALEGG